jgi:hypothetical protein
MLLSGGHHSRLASGAPLFTSRSRVTDDFNAAVFYKFIIFTKFFLCRFDGLERFQKKPVKSTLK